jgi:hypothetical protein
VRRPAAGQPHPFEVALALTLQAPAGPDAAGHPLTQPGTMAAVDEERQTGARLRRLSRQVERSTA